MSTDSLPIRLLHTPAKADFSPQPKVVGIEITGRCQLRCHHCFNHSGPGNHEELPLAVIERVLEEMMQWNVAQLRISGGEPTVHSQFREIITACERCGISISMNTNGIYGSGLLGWLKQAPISLFLISLDGMEDNNDTIRGRGTFRQALQSCRILHQAGKKVMISFHLGAGNQSDLEALIALAAEIGVGLKISPIRPLGRAIDELPWSFIQPRDYLQVVETVSRMRMRHPQIDIVTDFDIIDGPHKHACQRDRGATACKAGRTMVNINYDGGIYPCAFFVTRDGTFCAGNVYQDSITEVWQHSPVFRPFRIHQKSGVCQSCGHYRNRCVGGCPAIAYFITGCLDAHDPTCFAHYMAPPPRMEP